MQVHTCTRLIHVIFFTRNELMLLQNEKFAQINTFLQILGSYQQQFTMNWCFCWGSIPKVHPKWVFLKADWQLTGANVATPPHDWSLNYSRTGRQTGSPLGLRAVNVSDGFPPSCNRLQRAISLNMVYSFKKIILKYNVVYNFLPHLFISHINLNHNHVLSTQRTPSLLHGDTTIAIVTPQFLW